MSDAALLGPLAHDEDLIRLRGITGRGFHGVYPHERRDGQTFVVDVTLRVRRPSRADDLATTVDYGRLATAISAQITGEPVDLIETLAGRVADVCLADPLVSAVAATVHKPEAPIEVHVADASVTTVRARP